MSEAAEARAEGRRWRTRALVITGVIALFLGVAIGAANPDDEDDGTTTLAETRDEDVADDGATTTTAPRPTTTTTAARTPVAEDFRVVLIETKKSCFGTAGCNISYDVELEYGGPALKSSDTWLVTYEVRGGEDPKLDTLEVQGTSYERANDFVSTARSSDVLEAVVTGLRKR